MKHHSLWMALLVVGLVSIEDNYAQSEIQLKSVEWPGLGRTTAVCVAKNGLYVCIMPEGGDATSESEPKVFNEAGEEQPSKILHADKISGICLLESQAIDSSKAHWPLSERSIFEPGIPLISILPTARLRSRLAGMDREYLGQELPTPMLRIRVDKNTSCEPGTPVINEEGELEGVITNQVLAGTNEAHAIPAGLIRKVIDDVENHQRSGPIWIGMVFHSHSTTPKVIKIKKASPAEDAGIKEMDIIMAVNGRSIRDISELVEVLKFLPGEKIAKFTVLRDLDELKLKVVPKFVETKPE